MFSFCVLFIILWKNCFSYAAALKYIQNHLEMIKKLADFLEIPLTEKEAMQVLKDTSFDAMKQSAAENEEETNREFRNNLMQKGKSSSILRVSRLAREDMQNSATKISLSSNKKTNGIQAPAFDNENKINKEYLFVTKWSNMTAFLRLTLFGLGLIVDEAVSLSGKMHCKSL